MLRFENVDLHYGSFRALSGVSLHAAPGELVVLLGANGAGKTSIFMAASGIQKPSAGSIRFGDRELIGQRPAQIVASGLVHCPEGRKLFPMMSVRKNLTLGRTQKFGRGISRAAGPQFVAKTWRAGAPVTGWLDRHVGASTLPAESRRRPR